MWTPFEGFEGKRIYLEGTLWQYVGELVDVNVDTAGIVWAELSRTIQLFGESKDGPDKNEDRKIGTVRIPHTQIVMLQLASERWPKWKP